MSATAPASVPAVAPVDTAGRVLTSESVCAGHPDKTADAIADAIVDAYLGLDPRSRVACEVLCKSSIVVLAGEISSVSGLDHLPIVREAVRRTGWTQPDDPFSADGLQLMQHLTGQSWEIGRSVDPGANPVGEQGAGDQGIVYGYATDETDERLPLTAVLAHALARGLEEDRTSGREPWLRPDGKTQVSVRYQGDRPEAVTHVLVSAQHAAGVSREAVHAYVAERLAPRVLGRWFDERISTTVNPSGSFVQGGPSADCGLTGRKLMVDTYGGQARHGGGALSGKDPSKVDRSGAYFCRFVARQVVAAGLARRVEVQAAYAIGLAQPLAVEVDTFGTGDERAARAFVRERFDFRPAAIIERLSLLRPIYSRTTNYGHFGRPDLPWEQDR